MFALREVLLFGVPLVLSATSLATMHWYPWNRGTKNLDRVTAYTMGTAVVVGYPVASILVASALGLSLDQLFWAALLVANTLVSGATVKIAYWIDGTLAVKLEEVIHSVDIGY